MECTHRAIRSWSQLDGSPVDMWSCVDCGWRFEPVRERQPLTLEIHQPNESGSTLVTARWFVDTPHGWIGAWDREALEYILKGEE